MHKIKSILFIATNFFRGRFVVLFCNFFSFLLVSELLARLLLLSLFFFNRKAFRTMYFSIIIATLTIYGIVDYNTLIHI